MISLLLAGLVMPAFALDQTGNATVASVRGTVTIDNGRVVPEARVIAYSDVGVSETTTDANGHYHFVSLIPGTYYIRAYSSEGAAGLRPCGDDNPVELSAGLLYLADYEIVPSCTTDAIPAHARPEK